MKTFLLFLSAFMTLVTSKPVGTEVSITQKENFYDTRIYGKWYDIAIGSKLPWLNKLHRVLEMESLEFGEAQTDDEVQVTTVSTSLGACSQHIGTQEKKTILWKMNFNNSNLDAQIPINVVFTNFNEYAAKLTRKLIHGTLTTIVKLYGRTPWLRKDLIEDFKQFAKEQGIEKDSIFFFPNKGIQFCECSKTNMTCKRNEEEEGSGGMDIIPFTKNTAASCHMPPAPGPCLRSNDRFFYNSSSMACEKFQYGGCLGNHNNFFSEEDCLATCRTEDEEEFL